MSIKSGCEVIPTGCPLFSRSRSDLAKRHKRISSNSCRTVVLRRGIKVNPLMDEGVGCSLSVRGTTNLRRDQTRGAQERERHNVQRECGKQRLTGCTYECGISVYEPQSFANKGQTTHGTLWQKKSSLLFRHPRAARSDFCGYAAGVQVRSPPRLSLISGISQKRPRVF